MQSKTIEKFIYYYPLWGVYRAIFMDDWVIKWLDEQRRKGIKRLEIKQEHNAYYVYDSTTYWDKTEKKRKKHSTYIGKLDRELGLIESKRPVKSKIFPRNVWRYGDALLINKAMVDIVPTLKESFGDIWEEMYAMAAVRIIGYVPLKRIKSRWEKLYNELKINPRLDPAYLSEILRYVGVDRDGQNRVFKILIKGEQYAYDLSAIFTRSTMNIANYGYNKWMEHIKQLNLILMVSIEDHLPTMVRVVPGSVRDVSTLKITMSDQDINKIKMVLDRGFYSEENIDAMIKSGIKFIQPARRNSVYYKEAGIPESNHFFYRGRLIKSGKKVVEGKILYMYEDTKLREEEENTLYRELDEGKISKEELEIEMNKAGKILIVSNIDSEGVEIYNMYKERDEIEQQFDTYKNTLHADIMYLQDDETVFGHVFISFLTLYGYSKIQNMLREARLLNKVSPLDVIEELSCVYAISDGEKEIITEVPKKARILDEELKTNLFPKIKS